MSHLVMVILDDIKRMPSILRAWQSIGVPGVTILESTGGYRTTTWLSKVGLDFLDRLFEADEIKRRTLMAAIEEEDLMEQAVAEAERLMDGFERPNSGILLVLPIHKIKGLQKRKISEKTATLPPAIQPRWYVQRNSKVSDLLEILDLEPTIVQPDTPLEDVAKAMLEHPNVHIACVVNEEGRLIGIIELRQLSNDIFFHITPEEFFSEVTNLEAVMEFASESRKRIASDTMRSPIWIKRNELVKHAFERMHENNLSGLPVVDDRYQVTGYINLLELLAVCLENETHDTSQEGGK